MRVVIRDYSDECPDIRVLPGRHVYPERDLGYLLIHPLCCGSHSLPHATALIHPTEYAALEAVEGVCPGCAQWLAHNPHVIVVEGVCVRVADPDDVTVTQRGDLDPETTLILDLSRWLPTPRPGQAPAAPAADLVGA